MPMPQVRKQNTEGSYSGNTEGTRDISSRTHPTRLHRRIETHKTSHKRRQTLGTLGNESSRASNPFNSREKTGELRRFHRKMQSNGEKERALLFQLCWA